ncbi:MAG: hypothetical protein K8R02_07330 [Anaerohalosphaeraceae bacterium]|nr:hypothetical protein [Anaerohalosphaeraceae bacterium]
MEQHKCLGICIGAENATIAVVGKSGGDIEITDGFKVVLPASTEDDSGEFSYAALARQIAQEVSQHQLVFSDVAVSLDCKFYRQQLIHSGFADTKQIAQTIAFDAEETLAVDAANTAIGFEIASKGASGSEVSVFAASGSMLSEIILSLASNKLDPAAVEPDAICLRRIIRRLFQSREGNSMWAAVSDNKCYIVSPAAENDKEYVRTFITGSAQKKTNLLAREVIMTGASVSGGVKPDSLKVFDTTGQIDYGLLAEQIGFGAVNAQLPEGIKTYDADMLELITAAGAAIGQLGRCDKVDFRPGFMPYQGKKMVLEKTLKVLGVSVLIIFVTLGVYLHMKYYTTNGYRGRLAEKFGSEYKIAMAGKPMKRGRDPLKQLRSEIGRIKDVKSGILSAAGDDSLEARLTFLFEALNSVPDKVDLSIGKISVTPRNISVIGNTSGRGYLKLFAAIDGHKKLSRGQSTYESKDGRDHFRLTVVVK